MFRHSNHKITLFSTRPKRGYAILLCVQTVEENIKWVQDFNLNLGVNVLGGIFGVHEAFADPVKMLEEFLDLLAYSDELRDSYGGKSKEFNEAMRSHLLKLAKRLPEKSFDVLCKQYVPFYYEACARLRSNEKFVDWVKENEFSIMPDIFTREVLLYAISRIEINNKIKATVLETMHKMASGQSMSDQTTKNQSNTEPSSTKLVCGGVLSWIGSILLVIGWAGVASSILIMLNSPIRDGTWFVWLFFSGIKIAIGSLLRRVARRLGFRHSPHPVFGAIVGGFGILLSAIGWMGVVGVVLSLFSERSIFDPLNNGVISVFFLVFGSVVRYRGKRISGKDAATRPE